MEDSEETTFDLDKAMKDGMDRFEDTDPETDITQPAEPEETPLEETSEPETSENETEKPPEEPKINLRFKSHEEAEKGYRHIQSLKTKAEQQARELQARLKAIEEAQSRAKIEQDADTKFLEYSESRNKEALNAIDNLDPDDEDYHSKVAKVWAEKDRDVRRFDRETRYEPVVEKDIQAEPPDASQAIEYLKSRATESEVDPDDLFFKQTCERTPTVDDFGNQMSFEDQVNWAITRTKEYHAEQHRRFQERMKAEAEKKNKEFAKREQPLGRGSTPKPASVSPGVITLNDALESAMEYRRL